MNKFMTFAFLACILTVVEAQQQTPDEMTSAGIDLKRLDVTLNAPDIERVEIINLPQEIDVFGALTTKALEKQWLYKVTISRVYETSFKNRVAQVLRTSSFNKLKLGPNQSPGDMRWGCIFYNRNGQPVLSIYFDGWGKHGVINNVAVESDGKFVEILKAVTASVQEL